MKYAKILEKISAGKMTRSDLHALRLNAMEKFKIGDADALEVMSAIDIAKPVDSYILFIGFCLSVVVLFARLCYNISIYVIR